LFFNLFFDILM